MKVTPTVHNTFRLKLTETHITNEIIAAKSRYESQLVQKFAFKNTRPIFSYIRSFTNQSSFPSVMYLNTCQQSSNSGKAKIFNEFFHSVFSDCPLAISPPDTSATPSLCDNISFSEDNVYHVLSHLDVTKAMGIDHIPNYVLKCCATTLTRPIYHLFQQ